MQLEDTTTIIKQHMEPRILSNPIIHAISSHYIPRDAFVDILPAAADAPAFANVADGAADAAMEITDGGCAAAGAGAGVVVVAAVVAAVDAAPSTGFGGGNCCANDVKTGGGEAVTFATLGSDGSCGLGTDGG